MIFDSERGVYVEHGNRVEIALGKSRENEAHVPLAVWETLQDDRRKAYARAMAFFVDPKGAERVLDKRERIYRSLWEIPSPPTQPWKLVALADLGREKRFAPVIKAVQRHADRVPRRAEGTGGEGCRICGSRSHNQTLCPLSFCERCAVYGHKAPACSAGHVANGCKKRNSVRIFDHQRKKMLRDSGSNRCERW